jgi:YVTN family beta-propeller protein
MKSHFLAGRSAIVSRARAACSIVSVALAAAIPALAQAQLAPPASGLINPRAIVFSPVTGKVYAVDTSHNAVLIYNDASKQTHSVKVGAEPVSIAINTANGAAYVANEGDGTVSVIDANTDAVTATVPIGSRPYSIAVNSLTGKVYATHTFDDRLTILDGATNTATSLKTGSTDLISINSATNTIYLLGYEGGTVVVVDGARQTMHKLEAGMHAWGMTLNNQDGALYIARVGNASVTSLKNSAAVDLPAGAIPCAIALNSKTHTLYVANYGDNSVSVIDPDTGRSIATVRVGLRPKAVAFDPKRNLVFSANTNDNSITVIDAKNYAVLATLPAGKNPYALAVVPGSSNLYVANETDGNSSTVVDLSRISNPAP